MLFTMETFQIVNSLMLLLFSVFFTGVSSEICYYYPTIRERLSASCEWGCCSTTSSPCCDQPMYSRPYVVALSTIGAFIALCILFTLVVYIIVRRNERNRAAQSGAVYESRTSPAAKGANASQYQSAPQYYTAPSYSSQSPNRAISPLHPSHPNPEATTPLYPNQPYNGTTPPAYSSQPQNESTPLFSRQTSTETRPGYVSLPIKTNKRRN